MLILFNRCRSVDYRNAMSASMSVSSLLLQIVMKILMFFLFNYSGFKRDVTVMCLHIGFSTVSINRHMLCRHI